jgi:hypothetical protein
MGADHYGPTDCLPAALVTAFDSDDPNPCGSNDPISLGGYTKGLEFHVGDVYKRHENFIFKIKIVCFLFNTLTLMFYFMLLSSLE